MRPVAIITPSLLALVASDWSGPELRAAIALLIEELDSRDEDVGVTMRHILDGRASPRPDRT